MGKDFVLRKHETGEEISLQIFALLFSYLRRNYMSKSRIVLFQISGCDLLCIPLLSSFATNKYRYKLCLVKKSIDNNHNIMFEYDVLCVAHTISEAKKYAKRILEYFST